MEMNVIIKVAQRRRAKLLAEKKRTGWTATKLALKYKMSRARMSQLLIQAKKDRSMSNWNKK